MMRAGPEEELSRLKIIAGDLATAVEQDPAPWLALLPEPCADPLKTDHAIARAHTALRGMYLRAVADKTSQHWRTPPTGAQIRFPGADLVYDYAYDRQHPPLGLERRLEFCGPATTRIHGGMVCSSGMSAILVALQALGYIHGNSRPRLGALASYFETLTLLKLTPFAGAWRRLFRSEELADGIRARRYGVIYIEPVRYDWDLGTVDWDMILDALASTDEKPAIVLDTTLSGGASALDAVLEALARAGAPLLVALRSGLKLDQEGLELGNLGVIQWSAREGENPYSHFGRIAGACRVVSGATVGWPEACALAPSFVLDPSRLKAYTASIFDNQRALREGLASRGALFRSITYPAEPWGAPFLFLRLRDGGADVYRRLAALLAREAARRGLRWVMSGSFGFRTERFETILPTEQGRTGEAPEGVLKIVAGSFQGEQFRRILALLQELLSFDELDEAARALSTFTLPIARCI